MIVYEKNNKLNINFENELDNPDIEIGKSEIKVDGNNIVSGGGSGGGAIVTMNLDTYMLVTMNGNPVSYNDIKKWGVVLYADIDETIPPDEEVGFILISRYLYDSEAGLWGVYFDDKRFMGSVSADAPLYLEGHEPDDE